MTLISKEFVPHTGNMSLLGEFSDFSEAGLTSLCQVHSDNIYLIADRLHNTILLEYMSQTIAAYAKMSEFPNEAASNPKIGFLLGVKCYKSSVHWLEVGDRFSVIVNQDIKMATGLAVFNCQVNNEFFTAQARLNVFQPPDVEQFLQELRSA